MKRPNGYVLIGASGKATLLHLVRVTRSPPAANDAEHGEAPTATFKGTTRMAAVRTPMGQKPGPKLNQKDCERIRRNAKTTELTQAAQARRLGISIDVLQAVVRGTYIPAV
jgi:hypothetical protein